MTTAAPTRRPTRRWADVFSDWRRSLGRALSVYDRRRGRLTRFLPTLVLFFIVLNVACYWAGILVAYPHHLRGPDRSHYFLLQVPVGVLGAVFDTASFFVTVAIVRRALRTTKRSEYLVHLSLDLVIAVLATFWVLFVFSASGWIMSHLEALPETLDARNLKYRHRLGAAVRNPLANWRNIYFGTVMGISASLPTVTHLGMFIRSALRRR